MGISVDDQGKNAALADKLDLGGRVPLLADPQRSAIRAYGVEDTDNEISLPATIVIDAEGAVRWIYVGDNPRDRPSVEEVLAAVSAR